MKEKYINIAKTNISKKIYFQTNNLDLGNSTCSHTLYIANLRLIYIYRYISQQTKIKEKIKFMWTRGRKKTTQYKYICTRNFMSYYIYIQQKSGHTYQSAKVSRFTVFAIIQTKQKWFNVKKVKKNCLYQTKEFRIISSVGQNNF